MGIDKASKFLSVIKTLRNNPLNSDVLNYAKTLNSADGVPMHIALDIAHKDLKVPISNIHQYAIDLLAKADNNSFYGEPFRGPTVPDTLNPGLIDRTDGLANMYLHHTKRRAMLLNPNSKGHKIHYANLYRNFPENMVNQFMKERLLEDSQKIAIDREDVKTTANMSKFLQIIDALGWA